MIMTAHVTLPKVDDEATFADGTKGYYPATMSKKIMTDILRNEMGYKGVVVTDALEMQTLYETALVSGGTGATDSAKGTVDTASTEYKVNLAEKVINAGCDILLLPSDLNSAARAIFYDDYIAGIAAKVESGAISQARIDESVMRILTMKQKYGILDADTSGSSINDDVEHALGVVGSNANHTLEASIAAKAVTLVKNDGDTLPFSGVANPLWVKAPSRTTLTYSPSAQKISNALSVKNAKGAITYSKASGDTRILVDGSSGAIAIAQAMPAGTYPVAVRVDAAGDDVFSTGFATASFTVKIAKATSTLKMKPAKTTNTVKAGKKTTIKKSKAFKVVKNTSKGKLTFTKLSGNKKITVSKVGKVVVKKGLKRGKAYVVKVRVTSAETRNYKSAKTTIKLKVKVG